VILTWTGWRHYGDRKIIEQNWAAMDRYLQFILDRNPNCLWLNGRGPDLGDWVAVGDNHFMRPDTPPTTPMDLFATAHWAHSADLLAQMADASGRRADAERLRAVHARVRQAFIEAFVQPDGRVDNGSQTSHVLALHFGLVPAELRARTAAHLVADIRRRGVALSTGFPGTRYCLDVLAEAGYADVVYSLLLRTEYPSWGYMIAQGATTIWERWDGSLDKRHATASHNHFALGAVAGFLFRRVAGIEEAAPGFERIRVRPLLDPRIQRGGGEYQSVMGRISTDWEQAPDGAFSINVVIPPNTTARIHLPARPGSRIEESGQDISRTGEIRIVERSEREAVVDVGSGTYRFLTSSFVGGRGPDGEGAPPE
jgi:alpha-L-rhamnosidase